MEKTQGRGRRVGRDSSLYSPFPYPASYDDNLGFSNLKKLNYSIPETCVIGKEGDFKNMHLIFKYIVNIILQKLMYLKTSKTSHEKNSCIYWN